MIIYIKGIIIAIILGVTYYPTFIWMWQRWNAEDTYYSHGPLIIIASLFFLWNKREILKKLPIDLNFDKIGIFFLIVGFLFHITGSWIKIYFISAVSLLFMLAGIIRCIGGREWGKKTFFPVVYLIFMIPMPMVLVSNIVLQMKLFAAEMATLGLQIIGLEAVRDGSIIRMPFSILEVEAPCSGLRSLIALLAFGTAFAYLSKHSNLKKLILCLAALPIALGANVMRIVLLGWVSDVYGMEAAQGWIHDFSGYLLFASAALGMLSVDSLLTKRT